MRHYYRAKSFSCFSSDSCFCWKSITESKPEDPENERAESNTMVNLYVVRMNWRLFKHWDYLSRALTPGIFAASWPRPASGDGALARLSSLAASARPHWALYLSASARVRPGNAVSLGGGVTERTNVWDFKINKYKNDAEDDECWFIWFISWH